MAAITIRKFRNMSSASMRDLIRRIDKKRREMMGIFEFSTDRCCIFRASIHPLSEMAYIPEASEKSGTKALNLHFWNEQVPPLPSGGPDLGYAKNLIHKWTESLRQLANFILRDPRAEDVTVIIGITPIFFSGNIRTGINLIPRTGMHIEKYHPSAGPVRLFFDDLYAWMLMWTYNPNILYTRKPFTVDWHALWISREVLVERFADPAGKTAQDRGKQAATNEYTR